MSDDQRRAYIFFLALSLVLFIQSSPALKQLSGEEWLAILLTPMLLIAEWPRRPLLRATDSAIGHAAAEPIVSREQTPPAAEAPARSHSPQLATTWQRDVDNLAHRYPNPYKFALSPLVYAPDGGAAAIIEACFPADSPSDETRMLRDVILIGRDRCRSEPFPKSQKELARDVMRDIETIYAAKGKPSPVKSIDIAGRILAGTYDSLKRRLAGSKPNQPDQP